MFSRSTWAQPATVVAGNSDEPDNLASVHFDVVALPATVVAGNSDEPDDLASVRLEGVGLASHCDGGHDR
jgi:hypothetical protein